ncbi:hypothetical protein ACEWY4_005699 [Coilia grayii]|uniref:Uncharacterized protein n=1 Tax=Coilia grayii TaxID=363190 RepID=A0ABD1KJ76_9TELE
MFFHLPRLTPGYIRYLQTQAMHRGKAKSLAMPRVAVLLGAVGIGVSGYSSRQLALHHRPSTRLLQWMDRPVETGGGNVPLATQGRFHTAVAAVPALEQQLFPEPKGGYRLCRENVLERVKGWGSYEERSVTLRFIPVCVESGVLLKRETSSSWR